MATALARNVAIVTNVRLYREGIARALENQNPDVVVRCAGDQSEALTLVAATCPDVVLVDANMPSSIATIRAIVGACATVRVVVLAVDDQDDDPIRFAEAGVVGFVTREQGVGALVETVAAVAAGDVLFPPRVAAALLRRVATLGADREPAVPSGDVLTRRESEIVRLIDVGCSNKDIARELCISVATVKNHVHNILDKLQVSRRGEAAATARQFAGVGGAAI